MHQKAFKPNQPIQTNQKTQPTICVIVLASLAANHKNKLQPTTKNYYIRLASLAANHKKLLYKAHFARHHHTKLLYKAHFARHHHTKGGGMGEPRFPQLEVKIRIVLYLH